MKKQAVKLIIAAIMLGTGQVALAQSEFFAILTGPSEVPPVATVAFGTATFDVNLSASVVGVNFELAAFNTPEAFMAHIHCAPAGQNGPVVVWLAGDLGLVGAPTAGHDIDGTWVGNAKFKEGNVIPGTPCGNTLLDLLIAMVNGQTYVNIHTVGNPGGEIRGQIVQVAPVTVP